MKIQIIEDNIWSSDSIVRIVESIGYEVTDVCPNMNSAIASFNKNRPDLIIMDIELQDNPEGGIELTKIFNEIDNSIPIIYCSDKLKDGDISEKAAQTMSVAILSKNFNSYELQANIKKAEIEKRRFLEEKKQNLVYVNRLAKGQNTLNEKIDKILKILLFPFNIFKRRESFSVSEHGGFPQVIYYDELCYLHTSTLAGMRIITDSKRIHHSNTLSNFVKQHNHPSWLQISQANVINMDKAITIDIAEKSVVVRVGGKLELVRYSHKRLEIIKEKLNFQKIK